MAVIKEIKNGSGGVIRIHDDYCKNNTPEDNQKIIDKDHGRPSSGSMGRAYSLRSEW